MMWSERHRPADVSFMVGNEEARREIVEWFAKWRKGTKPLLLVGPPGTGKTTIAYIAARQFGYDMIGLNASDVRSKSRINEILAPVLGNVSVMGSPMIFVDEVDGIHGRGDYGGAAALADILKDPAVPILLAANSDAHDRMKGIKKAATTVRLRKVPPRLLRTYLGHVLRKEGASLGPGSMIKVISKSRGDIRSMINLAQSQVTGFDPQTEQSFESVDAEEGIGAFFKAKSEQEARGILYAMQTDPREKIGAFYSSVVTSDLDAATMAELLGIISEADMLFGKIMRTQNWRLLRYLNDILVRLYREGSGVRYSRYNLPWPLLNRIRWDGAKIRLFSSAMAGRLHQSSSSFVASCLPLMLLCIRNGALEPAAASDEEAAALADILKKEGSGAA